MLAFNCESTLCRYELVQTGSAAVLRRGSAFTLAISWRGRAFDPRTDRLKLVFDTGLHHTIHYQNVILEVLFNRDKKGTRCKKYQNHRERKNNVKFLMFAVLCEKNPET